LRVHDSELGGLTVQQMFRVFYFDQVYQPMMADPNQHHTNHPTTPRLVDLAPFPCYLRPWN
jgi:hypothetical protein